MISRWALQIAVTCCNYFLDQFSFSFLLTKNDAKENIGWACLCHHIVSKQLLTAFIFKVKNNDNCGISNLDSLIRSSSLQQSTIEGLLRSEGYMQIAQRKYIFHNKPSLNVQRVMSIITKMITHNSIFNIFQTIWRS